jgi:hypothetical protein
MCVSNTPINTSPALNDDDPLSNSASNRDADSLKGGNVRIAHVERTPSAAGGLNPFPPSSVPQKIGSNVGITLLRKAGLLQQASVELGEHLSMHPALRTDHMTVGIIGSHRTSLKKRFAQQSQNPSP